LFVFPLIPGAFRPPSPDEPDWLFATACFLGAVLGAQLLLLVVYALVR
jgi:hypothetical protein